MTGPDGLPQRDLCPLGKGGGVIRRGCTAVRRHQEVIFQQSFFGVQSSESSGPERRLPSRSPSSAVRQQRVTSRWIRLG
ncbi:hypothetical protein GN956_G5164 [Arapaima gigas]